MSFDLFAQTFLDGDATADERRLQTVLAVIRPFIVTEPTEDGFCQIMGSHGEHADFYVRHDGGFMVNHFSPGAVVALILRAATAGDLVILGPDLPAVLTDAGQLDQLPEGLRAGARRPVLVLSGDELERLIADDEETERRCRERLEGS